MYFLYFLGHPEFLSTASGWPKKLMIRHLSTGCEEGKAQESHTWWRAESNQLQKQAGILRRIKTVFMQGIYLDIT